MKKNETIGAFFFFILGLLTALFSFRMPLGSFRAAGTGLFPLCLGVVLMGLSLPLMIEGLRKNKDEFVREEGPGRSKAGRNVAAFLGITALCIFLFSILGFAAFSFLIIASLMWLLGMRKWLTTILFSLCVALACHILFVRLLKIPLPKGLLGI